MIKYHYRKYLLRGWPDVSAIGGQLDRHTHWRTIKYEEIYLNDYKSMSELRYSIDNYIVKYNSRRLHSAIGNKTPNEVYDKAINSLESQNQELRLVA